MRIVQAYGRVGSEKAVQLLLKKLNYSNHNVNRAAFEAVSTCGFNITGERVIQFKAELEEYVNVLVWNMSVYHDLEEQKASEVLLQALNSEVDSNYDSIFKFLTLLYDPKTIALIKDNIFSKDPEKSEYAFGLLEVTLEDAIKPYLLQSKQIKPLKQQLRSFKYNLVLFNKIMVDEKIVPLPNEKDSIIIGNPKATKIITMVSNPYCKPCAKVHKVLEEWLSKRDDIKLQIISSIMEGNTFKALQN
ncbi:MAG: hypothetical protein EOO43_21335 [Flavobacterium sp.]|nr:MAG: hypothetical protein EOO43_21335 [Flavobacterium sp.]